MLINEIIKNTIQGEGIFTGTPAAFIRTNGCIKPYCWFCDTKYALNEKNGKEMTIKQIIKQIPKNLNLVVISGGEPYKQKEIYNLFSELLKNKYNIQVETSGKISFKKINNVIVVCSPKEYFGKYIITKKSIQNSDYFKFVVSDIKSINKAIKFINDNKINKNKCYFMPLNTYNNNKDKKIQQQIWKYCSTHNIKYCARLHIIVFGKKKGI